MKNVAKVVMLSLVVVPMLALGGCAKKCHEPMCHKVEKMEKECGGK